MKYRLVQDGNNYHIEIYGKNGLFFGEKSWKRTTIGSFLPMSSYKTNNHMSCKLDMFSGLSFQNKEIAEIVYDYIVSHNTLNDDCIDLILHGEIKKEKFINILRQN